jgi:hypothetical protein
MWTFDEITVTFDTIASTWDGSTLFSFISGTNSSLMLLGVGS